MSELARLGENSRRVAINTLRTIESDTEKGDRADTRIAAQGMASTPGGRPGPLARHLRRELGNRERRGAIATESDTYER